MSKSKKLRVLQFLGKRLVECGLLAFASIPFMPLIVPNNKVRPWIEKNLETITKAQESALGIQHFGRPKINFTWPDHFTFIDAYVVGATYDPEDDTIYFNTSRLSCPEKDWWNFLFFIAPQEDADAALYHELGHFCMDKIYESLMKENWNLVEDEEFIGKKLISEGIAEYFKRELTGEKDCFNDRKWPSSPNNFTKDTFYSGRYHLVKSILDKYHTKGIIHLMENLPTEYDLRNLPEYQKRMLEALLHQ